MTMQCEEKDSPPPSSRRTMTRQRPDETHPAPGANPGDHLRFWYYSTKESMRIKSVTAAAAFALILATPAQAQFSSSIGGAGYSCFNVSSNCTYGIWHVGDSQRLGG